MIHRTPRSRPSAFTRLTCGFAGVLLICADATAATRYVATTGVNSGAGGSSAPWQTIVYAVQNAAAGDTILVRPGTYWEGKILVQKNNLTIRAADSANKPLINFNHRTNPNGNYVWVDKPGLTWDGVNITNAGSAAAIWAYTGANGIKVQNTRIDNSYQAAVRVENIDGATISNCVLTANAHINSDRTGANGWPHAVLGFNAKNVSIWGNTISRNHGEGVGPFSGCSGWYIGHNTVYDNFAVNIYVDTEIGWVTVENNHVYYTGYSIGNNSNNRPAGIRVANEVADFNPSGDNGIVEEITIRNNFVFDCKGGIEAFPYSPNLKFKLRNARIQNNTVVRTKDSARGLWISAYDSGVVVQNNIVRDTGGITLASGVTGQANFTADPAFTNGTGNNPWNYRISAGSACRDTGVTASGVTIDFWSQSRPHNNKYDIGAHEYR